VNNIFDTVIVSDIHLGARNSRAAEFVRFLEAIETDRLVIAGDLFEDPRLRGVDERHIAALRAIREYSMHARVDWLTGNHDPTRQWFEAILGVTVQQETLVRVGGASYLVYHGHAWDPALKWPRLVLKTADAIYATSQRIDRTHRLARWLKRRSKSFCRSTTSLAQRAVAEALRRGLSGVVTGHTHLACDQLIGGVHYLNSGCWTESPSTFIGVRDGEARLFEWDAIESRLTGRRSADRPCVELASAY
jgi:UDP-2,3-diacylglucosamine pyrophosphatase LpxH